MTTTLNAETPTTEEPSSPEYPSRKYILALNEITQIAWEKQELEAFVEACASELSWIAVTRGQPALILSEILSKLSWYIREHTRHLNAEEELKKAKAAGDPIH